MAGGKMLKGKWLRYVVIGGIAALLVVIGLSIYQAPRCFPWSDHLFPKIGSADKEYDAAAKEAAAWATAIQNEGMPQIPCPDGARDCAQSYHDALDLKAQWAAAKAALDMACLNIYQFIIGLAGLFGLIATIFYTHRTLRLSDQTSKAQLRAYVLVDKNHVNFIVGEIPSLRVELKNFGQTPASSVKVWTANGFHPLPMTTDFPVQDMKKTGSSATIGPGATFFVPVKFNKPLTNETWNAIRSGTHAIFVVGGVNYKDAFGSQRETRFCMFTGGSVGSEFGFSPYTEGNDSD